MIGNDHVGFGRGPSGKGPAQLAPRSTAYLTLLANDVHRLNRPHWVMLTSMLKTLAAKHNSTGQKMAAKHSAKIETPHGLRACLQVVVERSGRKPLVARFGGIPLQRQKTAVLIDRQPTPATTHRKGTELIRRLRAGRCELCEHRTDVQVHQVRRLADLTRPGQPQPAWAQLMAQRHRKTLVFCQPCHDSIHTRRTTATCTT